MKKIYEKPIIELEEFDAEVAMELSVVNGNGNPEEGNGNGGSFGDIFGSLID